MTTPNIQEENDTVEAALNIIADNKWINTEEDIEAATEALDTILAEWTDDQNNYPYGV